MVGEGSEEVHGAGPIARVNRRELSSFRSKCCNRVDVISIVSTVVCDSYTRPRVPSRPGPERERPERPSSSSQSPPSSFITLRKSPLLHPSTPITRAHHLNCMMFSLSTKNAMTDSVNAGKKLNRVNSHGYAWRSHCSVTNSPVKSAPKKCAKM